MMLGFQVLLFYQKPIGIFLETTPIIYVYYHNIARLISIGFRAEPFDRLGWTGLDLDIVRPF